MKRFFASILLGLPVVALMAVLSLAPMPTNPVSAQVTQEVIKTERYPHADQKADVKVLLDKGHGSAVHIGGGLFLTAAHVVLNPSKRLDIKLQDKSVRAAQVLWVSTSYDIALIQADGAGISTSSLSCAKAAIGDNVTLTGNPMALEAITAFGRIASEEVAIGSWKSVLVVSGPTIPGQSGGAVYNEAHEVVGITVGLMGVQLGMFPSASGYGTIVPSSTICTLLGRHK